MTRRVRVVVVEDSLTVRERLCEAVRGDPELELVGTAQDGKAAIERCLALRPDVVSLDMMLPVMTGLAATEYLMAHAPTPILVVSASVNRGEVFRTLDALRAGAIDVLDKPREDDTDAEWDAKYCAALKLASRIRVITHLRGRSATIPPESPVPQRGPGVRQTQLVALGASTGGPGALADVLRGISPPLEVPVLVVLHIGAAFAHSFADWLDAQTPHRVSLATDGASLASLAGRVVVAPPARHLVVRGDRLALTDAPERHSCRPSVDVLFESLAVDHGERTMACLLTGMGRDGAAGLLALRRAGARTVAQDEASCVVYGMPREAAVLGAATEVLPLDAIGRAITVRVRAR